MSKISELGLTEEGEKEVLSMCKKCAQCSVYACKKEYDSLGKSYDTLADDYLVIRKENEVLKLENESLRSTSSKVNEVSMLIDMFSHIGFNIVSKYDLVVEILRAVYK